MPRLSSDREFATTADMDLELSPSPINAMSMSMHPHPPDSRTPITMSGSTSSRMPPPLPPRPTTMPRPAPPAIQETPASPTRASADSTPPFPYGLVLPPSPSFVPASPSSHRYPSQSGTAGTVVANHGHGANASFPTDADANLLPPPPAYTPVPQPGESTLPPDHSPLLSPAHPAGLAAAAQPSYSPAPRAAPNTPTSAMIPSLVSTLVPLLRSPTSYLQPIHPLPNLLYVAGSRLVLSPLSGSHLWHTASPLQLHILTLPRGTSAAAGTISITVLPLLATSSDSSPDGLLSTLVQLATAMHLKQYYFNSTLSAPTHDSVALTYRNPALAGYAHPPIARVSLNAELDDKKDARTGKTPRRTYCALQVPSVALSDEWVRANGVGDGGGAVLVVYADCNGGMLETNVVGGAVRAMMASAVVL